MEDYVWHYWCRYMLGSMVSGSARIMALMGAELILSYSDGSEPEDPTIDSSRHWQRCMTGHSASNLVPVIASNRIGQECIEDSTITFYGTSFITDGTGEVIRQASRDQEEILLATFDLDELMHQRIEWGVFRDRRPELYARYFP